MQIRIFNTNDPKDTHSPDYLLTYNAWKDVWSEEYAQLGKGHHLPSDSFTRQDQVISFLLGGQCAALACFRRVDLRQPTTRDDSWFAEWPEDVMDYLASRGPEAVVCSAFTVTKPFRKVDFKGYAYKDLLATACAYHVMKHTDVFGMLGSMRNLRGTQNVVSKVGATPLVTVTVNGEPTDLVVFDREALPPFPDGMEFIFRRHWVQPTSSSAKGSAA